MSYSLVNVRELIVSLFEISKVEVMEKIVKL